MYWNHRVMKRVVDGEEYYGIYEVMYDKGSTIPGLWDEEPEVEEESLESLINTLERMLLACHQEVLDHDAKPVGLRDLDEALEEAREDLKELGWDGLEEFPIKKDKDEEN